MVVLGNIEGTVVDAKTDQTISGVNVTVVANNNTTFVEQSKITGADGKFSFRDLEAGSFKLSFSKDGYEDNSKNVSVNAGQTGSSDVSLTPVSPVLSVSTVLLDFGMATNNLSFEITNKEKGKLTWNIVEDLAWLSVNPVSGQMNTAVSVVTVTVDRSQLTENSRTAAFLVNSNGGSATVNVSVGKAVPVLSITPATLDFEETEPEKFIYVSNAGVGTLSFSATTAQSWITLGDATGSVSTDIKTVKVKVELSDLTFGNYVGDIVINSNVNSVTVPVSMAILQPAAPSLSNGKANDITHNSAQVSTTLTSLGSAAVTQYGHCWSASPNPTTADNKTALGRTSELKSFTSNIADLSVNTVYYVRAYATNAIGTTYSDVVTFTTLPSITGATVQTISSKNIKQNQIDVVGNLTALNGRLVTDYGVCYSASSALPTIDDSKASNGQTTKTGQYTLTITGLQPSTKYYFRTYATNSIGTVYGNVIEATTFNVPLVADGLIAYYTFDDESFNEAQEKTEYNGTKMGSILEWSTDVPGSSGKSFQKNEYSNAYFKVSPTPIAAYPAEYSYSVWLKTTSDNIRLICYMNSAGRPYCIINIKDRKIYNLDYGGFGNFGNSYDAGFNIDVSELLLDGYWHLLSITRKNSTFKLYIDGVYYASASSLLTDGRNYEMYISDGIYSNFRGKMDNVRIYDRELSAEEIMEIYNAKQ
jgi:hypothetical protein